MRKIISILLLVMLASAIAVTVILITRPAEQIEGILIHESRDSFEQEKVVVREYGLSEDSFYIHSGKVKRDQTLSIILNDFGVDFLMKLNKRLNILWG